MPTATDTATPEPTATDTPVPTDTPTPEPTATATEMAYLGGRAGLAAPLMGPELGPLVAPLAQPVTTTHRLISYTYDSLYRLTGAQYSTGESYRYTYPSALLRTGDAVGNRLSLTTHQGVVNYQYDRVRTNSIEERCLLLTVVFDAGPLITACKFEARGKLVIDHLLAGCTL